MRKKLMSLMFAVLVALGVPLGGVQGDDRLPSEASRIDEVHDGEEGYTHPSYVRLSESGWVFFSTENDGVTPVIQKKDDDLGFTAKIVSDTKYGRGLVLDEGMFNRALKRPWKYSAETLPNSGWVKVDYFLKGGRRLETLPEEYIRTAAGTVEDELDDRLWVSGKAVTWANDGNTIDPTAPLFTERFEDRDGLAARLSRSADGTLKFDFEGVTAPFVKQEVSPKDGVAVQFTLGSKSISEPPRKLQRMVGGSIKTKFADRFFVSVSDCIINSSGRFSFKSGFFYSEEPFKDNRAHAVESVWDEQAGLYRSHTYNPTRGGASASPVWYWARNAPPPAQNSTVQGK